MRPMAEKRHNDWRKAIRKQHIVYEVYRWPEGWYDNLHQYSKNKIYCSCPMCRVRDKKRSDQRRLDSANEQIMEFNEDDGLL